MASPTQSFALTKIQPPRARASLVVQADHRATRQIRTARLNLIASGGGGRLQMQHRDAVDDRENAALAAEDAVLNLIAAAAMKQRCHQLQPAAAVRTAQDR